MGAMSWSDVGGEVRSLTVTVSIRCDHCRLPVPINGPVQVARCPHCSKDARAPDLYKVLVDAVARDSTWDGYAYARFDDPSPECARCGAAVSVLAHLGQQGVATTLPCARCGTGMPTFPAPPWLKAHLPSALQVFGGDAEVAREQASLDLHVNEEAAKPVVMACPACGAGLTFTQATDRTAVCRFCSASVFMPDDLWKRLHPVKTMVRWTLTYAGTSLLRLQAPAEPQGELVDWDYQAGKGQRVRVHLRDGNVVEGEIVDEMTGVCLTIKHATGKCQRLEWNALQPMPPAAAAAPASQEDAPGPAARSPVAALGQWIRRHLGGRS